MQARRLDTYPSEDEDFKIRGLLTKLMRGCPLSREQIADEMSRRIDPSCELGRGQPVTKSMLDAFTAHHGRHARFPLSFAIPFCEAIGNVELLVFVLGKHAERVAELAREGKRSQKKLKR